MGKRKIFIAVIGLLVLASQTFGAPDTIYMRLNWKPGETFRYKIDVDSDATAVGERARIRLTSGMVLRVLGLTKAKNSELVGYNSIDNRSEQAVDLMEVELKYGDMKFTMYVVGQKVEFTISEDDIQASINGNPLPSYQLASIRGEMGPVQNILKARICLSIADDGRVIKVTGLEDLGTEMKDDLTMCFFDAAILPKNPLKVGDSYTEKRSIRSILPKQPGQQSRLLADETIELIRTLQSIKYDNSRRRLAEFSSSLKQKFEDIPLDVYGTRGSAEFDILYTTLFDADLGIVVRETATGTVLLRPKGVGMPSLITVKIKAVIELVEDSEVHAKASE